MNVKDIRAKKSLPAQVSMAERIHFTHQFLIQAIVDHDGNTKSFEVLNSNPMVFMEADARFVLKADLAALDFARDLSSRCNVSTHFNIEPSSLINIPKQDYQPVHDNIVVEIVERGLEKLGTAKLNALIDAVHDLKDAGFKIAMDDVSWTKTEQYLFTHIQPEFIKTNDWVNLANIRPEIKDAEIVAEMVENEIHAQMARVLGADLLQGFYFSRPMPAEELFAPGNRTTIVTA